MISGSVTRCTDFERTPKQGDITVSIPNIIPTYELVAPTEAIRHGKNGCHRILCEIKGNELYIKCRSCGELAKFVYNKENDKIEMVG